MIQKEDSAYLLSKSASTLVLRTTSFVADRGSLLHSGIYNREFSSILASFAFAGAAYFVLVMSFGKKAFFYAIFMVLFIVAFPLFRKFVFREPYLETVVDRQKETVVISLHRIWEKRLECLPLGGISGLRIDTKKSDVINRDGVEFVKRISAMHGTVIPGFGEETSFYSLKLTLADGTDKTVFAHSSIEDVLSVHDEIREFLKIQA